MISNAAVGVQKVKALVYILGFAPDKGESLLKLVTMNAGSQIGPKTLITRKYPTAGVFACSRQRLHSPAAGACHRDVVDDGPRDHRPRREPRGPGRAEARERRRPAPMVESTMLRHELGSDEAARGSDQNSRLGIRRGASFGSRTRCGSC